MVPIGVQQTTGVNNAWEWLSSSYLGGGEGDADLDLAVVRAVGEDDAVLRRVEVVRAVLRAQADDVRHVDPATRRIID